MPEEKIKKPRKSRKTKTLTTVNDLPIVVSEEVNDSIIETVQDDNTTDNPIVTELNNVESKKLWIVEKLKHEVLTIEFTKADGSTRIMNATLNEQILPTQGEEKRASINRVSSNPEVIVAWDIDMNGWRSFRIESLKKINNQLV